MKDGWEFGGGKQGRRAGTAERGGMSSPLTGGLTAPPPVDLIDCPGCAHSTCGARTWITGATPFRCLIGISVESGVCQLQG